MILTARKLFSLLLFAICYLLLAVNPASAQQIQQPLPSSQQNLNVSVQNLFMETLAAINCQLTGIDALNQNRSCLGVDPKTGQLGFVPSNNKQVGGLIGVTTNALASLYTPPIHTSDYVGYMAQNFGVTKKAHAATPCSAATLGSGFCGLSPLTKLWTTFANIVYFLFVIVFVLIGLAIMLRVKIDPRTVMSVENQLPKIIISLIMVSLSMGIAGLLIDLMWTFTYLSTNIIASAEKDAAGLTTTVNKEIYTPPPGFMGAVYSETFKFNEQGTNTNVTEFSFGGVFDLAGAAGRGVQQMVSKTLSPQSLGDILGGFPAGIQRASNCNDFFCAIGASIKDAFAGTILGLVTNILGAAISWIVGILFMIIFAIAILFSLFRLGFELLKAYVGILLDVALAPFMIVSGLIPGSPGGFGVWFRDIIANLSVFPTTIIMFMFGRIFMHSVGEAGGQFFVPPLVGNPNDANSIAAFVGLGIVLLTPQVLTIVRETLKAPQFKYSSAIGQAIGVGPSMVQGAVHEIGYQYGGLNTLQNFRKTIGGWKGIGSMFGNKVGATPEQASPHT